MWVLSKTFWGDINYAGDWTPVDVSDFDSDYETFPGNPLEYRLLAHHIEFRGAYKKITGTPGASPFTLLANDFIPFATDNKGLIPVYIDGNQIGVLRRTDGTGWQVEFNSGLTSGVLEQEVSGTAPLVGTISASQGSGGAPITGWQDFPLSAYMNGYTPDPGVALQWRSDGKNIILRGFFDGVAWVTSGLVLIDPNYFTGLGYTLSDDYNLSLIDIDSGNLNRPFGYSQTVNNGINIYVETAGTPVSNKATISGYIPLEL